MAFTKTLQDVYNAWYAIIKSVENSSAYPRDTFILHKINAAQISIINWWLKNYLTWEILTKLNLQFNNSVQVYTSVSPTTSTADMTVWWTSISATDTTYYSSTWYLWVDWDIIAYTGKTSTSFTGVTGINFAHLSGVYVRQLHALPSDFWLLNRAWYKNKYILVPIDQRDLVNVTTFNQYNFNPQSINEFWNSFQWNEYYYSIIDGSYFLPIVPSEDSMMIKLEYEKSPTLLLAASPTTQTLAIPDDYSLQTIPYIAFAMAMAERWETDEAYRLQNIWFENVKQMYSYYNAHRQEMLFNQRVRTGSDIKLNI